MTSLAFILGVLPWRLPPVLPPNPAKHRLDGIRRNDPATTLAIFVVPVLFVLITKISYGKKKLAQLKSEHRPEEFQRLV